MLMSGSLFLVPILLQASLLKSVLTSRCFCGFGGICQFDSRNNPIAENCSQCDEVSGSLYESDCRTLARHCNSTVCKNGGTCVPVLGATFCICPTNYFDVDCSKFSRENITERLDTPVIYFRLHRPPNEDRNVYIGVLDFGEDFSATITFKNIGTQYDLNEFDFDWMNLKSVCLNGLNDPKIIEDPNVCKLLPDRDIHMVVIPHRVFPLKAAKWIELKSGEERGFGAYVDVLEVILRNGQDVAFNQTYKLLSPVSKLDLQCRHNITLYGCSTRRKDPVIFRAYNDIIIEAFVYKPTHGCHPIKVNSRKWFHMTHRMLYEITESENTNMLRLRGATLSEGIHEIHYMYTVSANPPHYGTNNSLVNAGLCWFNVYKGPVNVAFRGGDLQSVPCNKPFTLTAVTLNPNHRIADMNFTWTCNNSRDQRCAPQFTQAKCAYTWSKSSVQNCLIVRNRIKPIVLVMRKDNLSLGMVRIMEVLSLPPWFGFFGFAEYPASPIGCESFYEFYFDVTYFESRHVYTSRTVVAFKRQINYEFHIECIKNCLPAVNVQLPTLLSVESNPPSKGALQWTMTDNEGSVENVDEAVLKKTRFGEFLSFEKNYFFEANNFTIKAIKAGATAEFRLNVREPLGYPVCNVSRADMDFPALYNVTCIRTEQEGVYYLIERASSYQNGIAKSSTGNFLRKFFCFDTTVVYFVNLLGESSVWTESEKVDFTSTDPHIMVEYAKKMIDIYSESGDFQSLLRFLNMISYYYFDEARLIDETNSSSSRVMYNLLKKYDKLKINEQDERMLTSLNFVQLLTKNAEDEEILPSYNRHFISKGLKECTDTSVQKAQTKEWAIATWLEDIRILQDMVSPHIQGLARRDILFDRPLDLFDPLVHQTTLRLNEKSSYNFFESLNNLKLFYSFMLYPFEDAVEAKGYDVSEMYYFWGIVGTQDFILKKYESDYEEFSESKNGLFVALRNHSAFTRGDSLSSSRVSFQLFRLQMDVMWWHRFVTIHTEVILASLFRIDDQINAPPSDNPFEIKLNVLSKYYHLLNGSLLEGTTSLPGGDDELNKDQHIPRYIFPASEGINKIHFEFLKCTSSFGCRLIIREYVPEYTDFLEKTFEKSVKEGVFISSNIGDTGVKYYAAVLPGREEIPGKQVNFTIRFRTAICKTWEKVERIKSGCQFDRFENNTMVANATQFSWFAMSIYNPVFTRVFHLAIDLKMSFENHFFVAIVILMTAIFFFAILLWAIWMDRKDSRQRNPLEIFSVAPYNSYPYAIGVYTGATVCHTTSNVAVRLIGDTVGTAGLIKRPGWATLKSGTDDWFLLYTRDPLGLIQEIHLWHDNNGFTPDWYCDKVVVVDLVDNRMFECIVRKQFTVAQSKTDDARLTTRICRVFPSYDETIRTSGRLFRYTLISQMMNKHLLLSLFYRHKRNPYSSVDCTLLLWGHCLAMFTATLVFWQLVKLSDPSGSPEFTSIEWIEAIAIGLFAAHANTLIISYIFRKSHAKFDLSANFSDRVNKRMSRHARQSRSSSARIHKSFSYSHHSTENYHQSGRMNAMTFNAKRLCTTFLDKISIPTHLKKLTADETPSTPSATKSLKFARVTISSVIAIYIILLVAFGLNMDRSLGEKWLIITVIGILIDLILLEPLFLVLNASILYFILKKTDIEIITVRFDVPISTPKKLHPEKCVKYIEEGTIVAYKPLLSTIIEKRRKRRANIKRFLLTVILVLFLIMIALLAMHAGRSMINFKYHLVRPIRTMFLDTNPAVDRVFKSESIGQFIKEVFVPSVNTQKWYNGVAINNSLVRVTVKFEKRFYNETKSWLPDGITILLKLIRLSQYRVKNESRTIATTFRNIFKRAYAPYSGYPFLNDDQQDYCEGWTNITDCFPHSRRWVYTRPDPFFLWQGLKTYAFSSYAQEIHWASSVGRMKLVNLDTDKWIDERTRAVVLEFNLYNRFVDGVTAGGILFEIRATGVVVSKMILECSGTRTTPDIVDSTDQIDSDKFINLVTYIKKRMVTTVFLPCILIIPVTMLVCYILTKLSRMFNKSVLGFYSGFRLVLKMSLIMFYFLLLNSYTSFLLKDSSILSAEGKSSGIQNSFIPSFLNKFPLMVGFCIVVFIRAKRPEYKRNPIQTERIQQDWAELGFRQDSDSLRSAFQYRLNRLQVKFAKIKTD